MVEQDGGGDGVQRKCVDGKKEVCNGGEMVVDWCREPRGSDTNGRARMGEWTEM